MRLLNKTKHSTRGLRFMLYDLASQANISTRGVTVEVRRGSRHLHGICNPTQKRIILWLLNTSKTDDIAFLWLHELAHTTPRNRKLYACEHPSKAQEQASNVATRVTGITEAELEWHSRDWRLEPTYMSKTTKKEALAALHYRRFSNGKRRTDNKLFQLSPKSKRGKWRLEYKIK